MIAKSPSHGPLLTPLPLLLSTETQKSNFHKRKPSFLQQELLDDFFCGFWRLLGRQEKEKKKKNMKTMKNGQTKEKKKWKNKKYNTKEEGKKQET